MRLARSQELEMHKQETAALESECKRLSEALNTAETHRKTLEDALRMTEKHARIEELKNKSALARIAQNANAQGRSGLDPIVRELKVVFAGTVVEILSGKDHLPEPKFMKVSSEKKINSTSLKSNSRLWAIKLFTPRNAH